MDGSPGGDGLPSAPRASALTGRTRASSTGGHSLAATIAAPGDPSIEERKEREVVVVSSRGRLAGATMLGGDVGGHGGAPRLQAVCGNSAVASLGHTHLDRHPPGSASCRLNRLRRPHNPPIGVRRWPDDAESLQGDEGSRTHQRQRGGEAPGRHCCLDVRTMVLPECLRWASRRSPTNGVEPEKFPPVQWVGWAELLSGLGHGTDIANIIPSSLMRAYMITNEIQDGCVRTCSSLECRCSEAAH